MNNEADLILISENIFTGLENRPFPGYVALEGDRILKTGKGAVPEDLIGKSTRMIELKEKSLLPGFTDVHCFFTGYVIRFLGTDLSDCENANQVYSRLKEREKDAVPNHPIFAHGLKSSIDRIVLDEWFIDHAVVLFHEDLESCSMNSKAIKDFDFTPDRCYPEAYVKILPYVLGDKEFIRSEFIRYMKMMNSKGVTAIKEMGFDDYCGFTDTLAELEKEGLLSLRVNFMSQPVAESINFEYGEKMRREYNSDMLCFSGYNQMTDGSVSEYNADLKKPYEGKDFCCQLKIDWKKLESDTLEADKRGFRFSLHAQGDGAIAKTLDIYEKCQRDEKGKLINRHAITDLEFSDPEDLSRMGKMGVIAEIYPQIQSIANRKDKVAMINEKIGAERGRYYWNRRKMADSGVIISCGTDLPLLIDDIPQSIYHAVGALFPEGGEPFNEKNTLTISELLKAWTYGGAYDLGKEKILGTIEEGKKADLAVIDGDIFNTALEHIRELKVCLTICDGKIVYVGEE